MPRMQELQALIRQGIGERHCPCGALVGFGRVRYCGADCQRKAIAPRAKEWKRIHRLENSAHKRSDYERNRERRLAGMMTRYWANREQRIEQMRQYRSIEKERASCR